MNGLMMYGFYDKRHLYIIVLLVCACFSAFMLLKDMSPAFYFSSVFIAVASINLVSNMKMRGCGWYSFTSSSNISKKDVLRSNMASYGIDLIPAGILALILGTIMIFVGPNDADIVSIISSLIISASVISVMASIVISFIPWIGNHIVRTIVCIIIAAAMLVFEVVSILFRFETVEVMCIFAASAVVIVISFYLGNIYLKGADL